MLKSLIPNAYFDSIYDIKLDDLVKQGIKGLIIDLDNTLIPRDRNETPLKLLGWLDELEKKGLQVCVVSNNKNSRGREISAKIKRPVIAMARKPARSAFKKALDVLNTDPSKTVVVGDQLFTDVFGGKRMGLKTVLVVPLKGKEFFTTVIMRKFERRILKRLLEDKRLQKNGNVELNEYKH